VGLLGAFVSSASVLGVHSGVLGVLHRLHAHAPLRDALDTLAHALWQVCACSLGVRCTVLCRRARRVL
jgi:hypothetical protein